ncbi:MAG: PAS domain S-box protein [Methanomassiliicoccales archaeon]|nr:PAS domain S-box protein [Methanomassiliicoccales archaeon]
MDDATWVRRDEGKVTDYHGAVTEATKEKLVERKLAESEEKYRELAENAGDGITIIKDGIVRYANPWLEELGGFTTEEIIGHPFTDFVWPDDRALLNDYYVRRMRGEPTPRVYEARLMKKDGTPVVVELNANIIDYEGSRAGFIIVRDVTDRKAAQEALQLSEQKYRTIFENTGTAMVMIEEDMTVSLVNSEFVRLTGFSEEEVEGKMRTSELVVDRDRKMIGEYHRLRRGGSKLAPHSYELRVKTKHGEAKDVILTIDLVPGSKQSIASLLDITERKKIEKILQHQMEEQTLLLDNVETMVWYAVDTERYGRVNQARADFLGRRKDEIEGKKLCDFLPPEEARVGVEGNRKVFETKSSYHGLEWVTNGKGEKRLMSVTKVPKLDLKGDVEFVVCSGHDVTELKHAQDALDLANKKLHLLGGVTRHDIANQLTVISGSLQMVVSSELPGKERKYLDMALNAGRNVERYLEFSRDYERMGTAKPEWISVRDACVKGISTLEPGDVKVEVDLEGIEIYADRMLERVFHNLVGNAIRHGEKVTRVRIFCQKSGDSLLVICEDDGKGIPTEMKGGLFEGRRGRGLYLVREILGITGMTIEERGEAGKGARFEIHVPKGDFRFLGEVE